MSLRERLRRKIRDLALTSADGGNKNSTSTRTRWSLPASCLLNIERGYGAPVLLIAQTNAEKTA